MNDIENVNTNEINSTTTPDAPRVIVFPPILILGALIVGIALQYFWPLHLWRAWPARILGLLPMLIGAIMLRGAFMSMKRAGTNVRPNKPTTAIVSDGPYHFSRNPIYLGNMMIYVGLALLFNMMWPLLTLIPSLLILHWGVVLPEEQYLEAKFGEAYLAYKSSVRRWI